MTQDQWETLGIVCGALLALLSLVGLIWRKVVLPLWRAAWRTIRRLNEVADDLLGDQVKGIPSMKQRMADLERTQAEHMARWHSPQANGPRPARTRREPGTT